MSCIQGVLWTWTPREEELTTWLCAKALGIFAFSPACPAAAACLVGQAVLCLIASLIPLFMLKLVRILILVSC